MDFFHRSFCFFEYPLDKKVIICYYKGGLKMQITQNRFKQLRKQGYTLEEIGEKYNISRQRVHQILNYKYQREVAPQPTSEQLINPIIKQWLDLHNMTPKELAKVADIPYYTLYCFLTGKTEKPQHKTLIKLTEYTGVPIQKLLQKNQKGKKQLE
jgi:transcriptional regulator with XRE-family HTH domain